MNKGNVTTTEIIDCLNRLTLESKSECGDAAGLLIGNPHKEVKKVLVALDVTEEVVDEAIRNNVDLIVSHHSALSEPVSHIKTDTGRGRMIASLLKHDIAVFSTHNCGDTAINGINEILCEKLGIAQSNILKVIASEKCYKLVTCIPVLPEDYTGQIREKLGNLGLSKGSAGAGVIGDYSHVCDHVRGIQNFVPLESAHPFIGEPGVLESVEVDRLEMIVPEKMIDEVIRHLIEIHPYEEVEYDLYALHEARNLKGFGRIGVIREERTLAEFIQVVKKELNQTVLRVVGDPGKKISKIAVCAGAKGSLIKDAHEKGADLFITGEVSFFEGQLAKELGIAVIDAGHWATEFPLISYLKSDLDSRFNDHCTAIEVIESAIDTEPFRFV